MTPAERGDRGQSTVELALVLPLVVVLLLLVLQGGLVVRDDVLLAHAAREAARAASVADGDRTAAATEAAGRAAALAGDRLVVRTDLTGRGERVSVRVRYRSATDVPLVGLLVPDVSLTAEATMRVEEPGSGR